MLKCQKIVSLLLTGAALLLACGSSNNDNCSAGAGSGGLGGGIGGGGGGNCSNSSANTAKCQAGIQNKHPDVCITCLLTKCCDSFVACANDSVCTACTTASCIGNSAGGKALFSCGQQSCSTMCTNSL
jgi:hypothetical protein